MVKKYTDGNGSMTVAKLFDFVENNNTKMDIKLADIKVEIQKNRAEVVEKLANSTSELRERLIKIEAQPAHENFQQKFCPNTSEIKELKEVGSKSLKEYIFLHQEEHKTIERKLDEISDDMKNEREQFKLQTQVLIDSNEKRLDERDARQRKALITAFLAIAAVAIPAIIELILKIFG